MSVGHAKPRRSMAARIRASQPQLDFESDVQIPACGDLGKETRRTRPFIRITVFTTHLFDGVDNLRGALKFLIDQLRYSTLISTDKYEEDFEIRQQKVSKKNEVGTTVQIVYPTQSSTVFDCD
jgi:hypothetical protein